MSMFYHSIMKINSKERRHLSFLMLMLVCFEVHDTKAQEDPLYKEIPGGVSVTANQMHRRMPLQLVNKKNLRIGVPPEFESNRVFQVKHDAETNSIVISGFCADVFQTAFSALDLNVSLQFIPFMDAYRNYNNLIHQVYTGVCIFLNPIYVLCLMLRKSMIINLFYCIMFVCIRNLMLQLEI